VLGVALALLAALSWGAADFLGGLAARGRALVSVMLISQAAGLVVLAVVAAPFVGERPSAADAGVAVIGGIAGVVALSLLYLGLAIGTMSVVAPIVALSAVVPVLVSVAGGDELTAILVAGIVLALGGAGMSAAAETPATEQRATDRTRSLWAAAGAAVGFGVAMTCLDDAADSGSALWVVIVARSAAVLVMALALVASRQKLDVQRPGLPQVVLVGVLDAASLTLFTLASNEGLLAVVSVLASLYPVVTVLLARTVLHERMRAVQVVGVALTFAGIAAVVGGT
jgi:drug/metabolite transporter (DMT)-like permease